LLAHDATKTNLLKALAAGRPAVVYTASHGLGLEGAPVADQRRLNGAIFCDSTGTLMDEDLLSADDVPDSPFLEGGIFFQFACYGYATPATSDYQHWLQPGLKSTPIEPFVAALPKRLLAHPHGPIAYIGHVDTAFLHAFADPASPDGGNDRWGRRMSPFVYAIDQLLGMQPSGLAMQRLNERYNVANYALTMAHDAQRKEELNLEDESTLNKLTDDWIFRSDAKNYLVLGDPGAAFQVAAPKAEKR
jgi:hypothetical protein